MMNILELPSTRNEDLAVALADRPKRLSLAQFEALEVSDFELKNRVGIYELEELLNTMPTSLDDKGAEDAGLKPIHRFVDGIYTRELHIPPDHLVVGKRHAIEHIVMLTQGSCVCLTERGVQHMKAPMTFISPAGEKRVVWTTPEEDCTWVTIHRTDEKDLDAVENDVIIAEPARKERYKELRAEAQRRLTMTEVTS